MNTLEQTMTEAHAAVLDGDLTEAAQKIDQALGAVERAPHTTSAGDAEIERAIKEAGADEGPRVTPEHIESVIVSEDYFTADEGVYGGEKLNGREVFICNPDSPLRRLTFCVLTLKNGFTVTGQAACVSHLNFDSAIGKRIARENAKKKIWELEGYALASSLADVALPALPEDLAELREECLTAMKIVSNFMAVISEPTTSNADALEYVQALNQVQERFIEYLEGDHKEMAISDKVLALIHKAQLALGVAQSDSSEEKSA